MDLPDFLNDADGEVRLTGHRISLMHVVDRYNDGYSVEGIACEYPTLKLAHIHKVIAFYLENRAEIDLYIAGWHEEIERQRANSPHAPSMSELRRRLEARQRAETR